MHENVKRFVVNVPNIMDQSMGYISSFFDDVIGRMPMLTHLELLSRSSMLEEDDKLEPRRTPWMEEIEDDVLELIRGLPNLHVIALPPCHLTPRVAEQLSHLPNLTEIFYRLGPEQGYPVIDDLAFSFAEGAFPSLKHLGNFARVEQMTQFLESPFSPSNLVVLQIEWYVFDDPFDVHELSVAVAANCQLLTKFHFLTHQKPFTEDTYNEKIAVTLDPFRPLFSCTNITTFEMVYQYPLTLQLVAMEEIASKWPSLETLKLNNHPAFLPTHESLLTLPTLRSLLPFARHCPRLRHLGLFLHATTTDLPPLHELQSFQRLECLSMGASYLSEEGPVTHFLSQICPVGCRVESNVWVGKIWESLRREWETVDRWLPVLTRSRMEERRRTREESMERVRVLEAEVAALRSGLCGHGNSNIALQ
jgi:hypothetical protein